MKRLIAFDLDGTLAESKSPLDPEMGKLLGASPRTIDVHRARLFHKLGAATVPELVRLVLTAKPAGADLTPDDPDCD